MRVNVYAEEMTDRIEIIGKEIDGHTFTGLRFYLELPATVGGKQYQGPFMHRPGDDDSGAVTFWGKRDLRVMLRKALAELDAHYDGPAAEPADAGRGQGMLPDALVPHAKEWYRLCERRFAVERMTISGQLAEAIVEAISARPPSEAAAVDDADQRSAFEFAFTTGHLETDCRNFQRPQGGRYVQDRIEALWEGWQKCAALASQQAVKP